MPDLSFSFNNTSLAMTPYSIFCDFDGTISQQDCLVKVFDRFADASWRVWENKIKSGQVHEREALPRMTQGLKVGWEEAIQFVLDEISLDPDFPDFVEWARHHNHRIFILSGGFVEWILPLLRKSGLGDLPVYANSLGQREGQYFVYPRQQLRWCETQTHCKCSSFGRLLPKAFTSVYVGDGHTDVCVSKRSDLVFAKSFLASFYESQGKPYHRFESFSDVTSQLSELSATAAHAV